MISFSNEPRPKLTLHSSVGAPVPTRNIITDIKFTGGRLPEENALADQLVGSNIIDDDGRVIGQIVEIHPDGSGGFAGTIRPIVQDSA